MIDRTLRRIHLIVHSTTQYNPVQQSVSDSMSHTVCLHAHFDNYTHSVCNMDTRTHRSLSYIQHVVMMLATCGEIWHFQFQIDYKDFLLQTYIRIGPDDSTKTASLVKFTIMKFHGNVLYFWCCTPPISPQVSLRPAFPYSRAPFEEYSFYNRLLKLRKMFVSETSDTKYVHACLVPLLIHIHWSTWFIHYHRPSSGANLDSIHFKHFLTL